MTTQLMNIGALNNNSLIVQQFAWFSKKVANPPKERITRKLEAEIVALQRFAAKKHEYVEAITRGWAQLPSDERAHLVEVATANLRIADGVVHDVKGATPELTFVDITWWVLNRQRALRTLEQGRDALLEISDAILAMHESDQGWFSELLTARLAEAGTQCGDEPTESRGEIMDGGTRSLRE